MCRKCVYLICIFLVLGTNGSVQAEVFIDDFNTPHNYVADGVAGTMWDDFIGWASGETVTALNASIDRAGQLFISSSGAYWSEPWNPLGPFLFKVVKGDFIATVKVTDYAGTPTAVVYHNDGGLMARAYRDDAGPGEDWVTIDYFPIWNCGNFVWQANDNVRNEAWGCNNGKRWNLDPWLQLERKGNVFHFRTSADGVTWTDMPCSPKTRNDFDGLPLMVGLRHATYSTNLGYVAFDDFRLEVIVKLKAYDPVPADKAGNVSANVLQWVAGDTAAWHDLYLGTDPAALSRVDRYPASQTSYTHSAGFTPGVKYYWRVDEVEADSITIHTGDVWSFTAIPLTAWNPSPSDGAECVSTDADLAWSPGAKAQSHDVYFGTSQTAVASATTSSPEFKGNQTTLTCALPALVQDTLYYWRIDQRNTDATVSKGDVWSFRTLPFIAVTDPNLVGWWKLDDLCSGSDVVLDSSGYNQHGTLRGDPRWVAGYDGGALEFDGRDDYVELPIGTLIGQLSNSTFMTWANFANSGGAWQHMFDFGNDTDTYMFLTPRIYFIDPMRFAITTTGGTGEIQVTAPATLPSGWHHVAVTINANTRTITLYLDGEVVAQSTQATLSPKDLGVTTNNWLGRSQYADDAYYMGSIDDFRIYNHAMSQAQISKAIRGATLAWNPMPSDGSTPDMERVALLSWSPGDNAAKHDVYFGTDANTVGNADTSDTTGIYRGRQDPNTYSLTEALQWGKTYYWRIDEYNTDATISKGRTWSFTIADYLIVDDFEGYTDELGNRIFQIWRDGWGFTEPAPGYAGNGSGSAVGTATAPWVERTIVHGGLQSMPFAYDNSGATGKARYSETQREWATPQDWTRKGVKALTLWFYGDAGNSPAPLYVAVEDSVGNSKTVTNPDAEAVLSSPWQEWNIDLAQFSGSGVNLSSIKKMYIGVGNKTAPQTGGTGTMYFDDVRLYPARCVPSLAKPAADLNDDCVVDYEDVVVLTERWLDSGLIVTPVQPASANLVGHWKFDDGVGITAVDSSVNANNGTLVGDTQWVTGHIGGALRFDGADDYVDLPTIGPLIGSLTNCTFAIWANFPNTGGAWQRIFDFGTGETSYMFLSPRIGTAGQMRFAITVEGGGAPEQMVTAPSTLPSGWHHVAVTIDADKDTITLYLDGSAVAQNTQATLNPSDLGVTTNNWLGRSQYIVDAGYTGLLDDFRIYKRALNQAEVAALAGRTAPFSIPADMHQDGVINFKDFAELADSWLEEILWPQP